MTLRDRLALDGRTHSRYSSEDIDGYVEIAREAVAALEGQRGGWMDGYREGMNESDAVYILQIKQRDEEIARLQKALEQADTESQNGGTSPQVSTVRDREDT